MTPSSASVFDYEPEASLELRERGRESLGDASLRDVSFQGPRGGEVTAYLVAPPGDGPFPGVLFLHWGGGDRTEFLSDAIVLADVGAASLLIDAPHVRPGWQPFAFRMDAAKEREYYAQVVVELRRAVDVLESLDAVDSGRLAYVGHSLGATVGGAFAGVEDRMAAAVLMGGLPTPSPMPGTGEEIARQYHEGFSSISSEALVGEASCDILFQFARFDRHVPEDAANAYVEAAGDRAEARFYTTSHEFNDVDSRADRLRWLAEKLGLVAVE